MAHYNRLFSTVGERALAACQRLKLDMWKQESGNVICDFELHGTIGSWDSDDDEDSGNVKDVADISLLRELLERFGERKGGDEL